MLVDHDGLAKIACGQMAQVGMCLPDGPGDAANRDDCPECTQRDGKQSQRKREGGLTCCILGGRCLHGLQTVICMVLNDSNHRIDLVGGRPVHALDQLIDDSSAFLYFAIVGFQRLMVFNHEFAVGFQGRIDSIGGDIQLSHNGFGLVQVLSDPCALLVKSLGVFLE